MQTYNNTYTTKLQPVYSSRDLTVFKVTQIHWQVHDAIGWKFGGKYHGNSPIELLAYRKHLFSVLESCKLAFCHTETLYLEGTKDELRPG